MTSSFERRQGQRYAVLKYMYKVAVEERNNPTRTTFAADIIASTLPYPEQEIESALTYLVGEHLAEIVSTYHNGTRSYKLAHQGIKEIERSLQTPDEATEHFPAPVNIYFNAPIGAVQTGTHATADVTQSVGANFSDVFSLIEQMKSQLAELPQEQQAGAFDSIEILEDELKSQDKNPQRIRGLLAGLKGIAQGTVTVSSQVATLAKQLKDLGMF